MGKITTIIKTKTVEYKLFVTSDGKEYENESAAIAHQNKLDGTVKDCPKCNGKGRINGRNNKSWVSGNSWVPMEGSYQDVWSDEKCPDCKGKGYLTLNWS